MKKKIMTVGVLGAYDAGKTKLCCLLSNKKFQSGHQYRTPGIQIVYPEEKAVHYGLIDVPGSQEAHLINDENLIKKLPALSSLSTQEEVKNGENDDMSNTFLERYIACCTLMPDLSIHSKRSL